ncbi:MAG: hypothetical protein JWM68_4857 [Verrucomicrobiales bacterium]|nr:hypothetical protein [Verrucomicrobiales bacterium]
MIIREDATPFLRPQCFLASPLRCPFPKLVFRDSGNSFLIQNRNFGFRRIGFGFQVEIPVSGRTVRRPKSIFQIPEKCFLAEKRFSGNRNEDFRPEIGVPEVGRDVLGSKLVF